MRNTKEYKNKKWFNFRDIVFKKKGKLCEICRRDSSTTVIQCHHEFYEAEKEIWDYDIKDITVVCKGCHAREHDILEPDDGWSLIKVIDNGKGNLSGKCTRQKGNGSLCNEDIRFEHIIVHSKFHEEKIVGSTCIDHLTANSKVLAKEYQDSLKIIPKINSKLKELDKPLNSSNFDKKPWKISVNKKSREVELQYRLNRTVEENKLKIISSIKKEKDCFSANLLINDVWYKFENKRNKKTYSRIYSSIDNIKKLLLLIQEQQIHKFKNKDIIIDVINEEIKDLLKEMNYKIKR